MINRRATIVGLLAASFARLLPRSVIVLIGERRLSFAISEEMAAEFAPQFTQLLRRVLVLRAKSFE